MSRQNPDNPHTVWGSEVQVSEGRVGSVRGPSPFLSVLTAAGAHEEETGEQERHLLLPTSRGTWRALGHPEVDKDIWGWGRLPGGRGEEG